MKLGRGLAGCGAALAVTALAGHANAACTWGQNTVSVYNKAMTIVGVPVKTHVNWIVADSASGPEDVPYGNTPNQRVYGVDYPLLVEITQFTGLEWYTLEKADILESVREFQLQYEADRPQCPGVTSLATTLVVSLSEGVAGKAVVQFDIEPK